MKDEQARLEYEVEETNEQYRQAVAANLEHGVDAV